MSYPQIPEKEQAELDNMAREYMLRMYAEEYDAALATITTLRDKMLDWQSKYRKRFHKGYPIHNIGFTLYRQKKPEEARKYFIQAYIEDLLSADIEDEADSTPAGQTLIKNYGFDASLLSVLKNKVRKLKVENNIPFKPEEVLRDKGAYKDIGTKFTLVSGIEPQEGRLPYYVWDIVISYASENSAIVNEYAEELKKHNVEVFYADSEKAYLWGKNLIDELDSIYTKKGRFCVLFISKYYQEKVWTNQERRSAQARAFQAHREYILPVKIDDTNLPGIPETVFYVDLRHTSIKELVQLTLEKLGQG